MNWRDRAVCRAEDPDLFFPVSSAGPALRQLRQAKAVCGRCPVAVDCLIWALATGQQAGVWGGLSEDERRAIHRSPAATRRTVHQMRLHAGRTSAGEGERAGCDWFD